MIEGQGHFLGTPVGRVVEGGKWRFIYGWSCRCGETGDGAIFDREADALEAGRQHIPRRESSWKTDTRWIDETRRSITGNDSVDDPMVEAN